MRKARANNFDFAIQEGRIKNPGLLFDHKQGLEVPDLLNTEDLKRALRVAYGPAYQWLDIDRLVAEIQDPMTRASDARRYFLNQPSTDTDKYMDAVAWKAAAEPEALEPGTEVVLGYDGSRKDDATVLVASRLSDGKIFQIACWERPPGPVGYNWEVPRVEVDETVREAFEKYKVIKIWADPSGWQSYLDAWNTTFIDRVVAVYPASQRKLMAQGLDRFLEDVLEGRLKHDGSAELTRHVLNAVPTRYGQVKKPSQAHKIDGLIAAVLAYLDGEGAPRDGKRSCVVDPFTGASIVGSLKGLFNPQGTISGQYEKGMMGKDTIGMNWYMDQALYLLASQVYLNGKVPNA